jgi:UDP-N-acetylmuramate dehydrogenase
MLADTTSSNLQITENVPLRQLTRFAIGGPARLLVDVATEEALASALQMIRNAGWQWTLIGGGTNLLAADEGFPGVVLRYTSKRIQIAENIVTVDAGTILQELVIATIDRGLRGLETMTGIPGWVAGALYGNAGAYGHSIQERVETVRFFDGSTFRQFANPGCEFHYRESVFKKHKDWIITSATLRMDPAKPAELRATADGILKIRNEKYPPAMQCAGSIFKNLILADLPPSLQEKVPQAVIREGKVPSAYFLEQVGAKGMANGAIRVADYHANLIYNRPENADPGTARQVREVIETLKNRVRQVYGLELEEEVQYLSGA